MFTLPDLPYEYQSLEPHLDAATMEIHHTKHHAAYVKNLNAALEKYPELYSKDLPQLLSNLSQIPEEIRLKVRNHGGGHLNHSLFWKFLAPTPSIMDSKLEAALVSSFGSVQKFKDNFSASAVGFFGSGWTWLVSESGKLIIISTPNQDSPYSAGQVPLLGVDLWEHSYYLKFQNRRADYLSAWWNVVNWEEVSSRFNSLPAGS